MSTRRSRVLARGIKAAGFAALLCSRIGAAETRSFSLEWNAPAGCPSSEFVLGEMERLLGHPPGIASDRPVSLEATVVATGSAYSVRIFLTSAEGQGERTFRDGTCEHVALATALVASLAIDPEAVEAHTSATPPPATPAPAPPPRPPSPRNPAPVKREWGFLAGVESGIHLGIFPDPGARIGAVIGVSWRSLRYELVGAYDFQQYARAPQQSTRGARLQLDTLKLRACLAAIDGAVGLDACASTEAGWFFGQGVGISTPARDAYPWWAAFAGARVAWRPLDAVELRLEADVGVALIRPAFEITGAFPTFVYAPSRALGLGTLGAVVRFR